MERKVNQKILQYMGDYQSFIINNITSSSLSMDEKEKIIGTIQSYPQLTLDINDFKKRKRVKNTIPLSERCCAKRADGEQCTRKKKDPHYCGTHMKGIPHGTVHMTCQVNNSVMKKEVWVEEIGGIMYYLDNNNNVYNAEDIMSNRTNPKIIAKWGKTLRGEYEICN